jgi:hypothetical protein
LFFFISLEHVESSNQILFHLGVGGVPTGPVSEDFFQERLDATQFRRSLLPTISNVASELVDLLVFRSGCFNNNKVLNRTYFTIETRIYLELEFFTSYCKIALTP